MTAPLSNCQAIIKVLCAHEHRQPTGLQLHAQSSACRESSVSLAPHLQVTQTHGGSAQSQSRPASSLTPVISSTPCPRQAAVLPQAAAASFAAHLAKGLETPSCGLGLSAPLIASSSSLPPACLCFAAKQLENRNGGPPPEHKAPAPLKACLAPLSQTYAESLPSGQLMKPDEWHISGLRSSLMATFPKRCPGFLLPAI